MAWPLGGSFGGVDPQSYLRLLQRLLPDGYSQDEGGPRVGRLDALAAASWTAGIAVERAFVQSVSHLSTELLEEWERALELPNDAARTLEQRQQRVLASTRAVAGASRARVLAALRSVTPEADIHANRREHIEAAASSDDMIAHVGAQLDDASLDDPVVRSAVARVLRRLLPARCHPTPGWRGRGAIWSRPPDAEAELFVTEGATWGGSERLGRTVLGRQTHSAYEVRHPTNRLVEYAGLVALRAADLNAIQEAALMAPCAGAGVVDDFGTADTDQSLIHVSTRVNATTATVLDSSIDWRQRFVWASFQHSTSDIRPGQSGDTTWLGGGLATVGLVSTLDGDSTALGGVRWTFATNLHLYADATTGALTLYNATGSAVSIVGLMVASPSLVTGSDPAPRIHTFAEGDDTSALDSGFWDLLVAATLPRRGTGTSWTFSPGPGWLCRFGAIVGILPGETKVLDSQANWRDRVITTIATDYQPAEWAESYEGPIYPGNPNDDLSRAALATVAAVSSGYTGTGRSDPTTLHGYLTVVGDDVTIYADETTGALMVHRYAADPVPDPESLMICVLASEQTGQRSSPAASPLILTVFDDPIEPHFLNGLQDRALLGQAREGNEALACDAWPLGPKLDGHGFPDLWRQRGELRRQPVAGIVRRFVYANAAAGAEVVLDDTVDWRDRFVWAVGRRSTSAIGTDHNTLTSWNQARYTGSGSTGALADRGYGLRIVVGSSGIQLRARQSDGALVLRNGTGAMQYVTAMVTGTFQLGPRS